MGVIAQMCGKSSDGAAAWKKVDIVGIMEEVDMAQQRGKSCHSSAV